MSTPCSAAIKPRMEKTTKPAKKLVPLLIRAKMKASLQEEEMGRREDDYYLDINLCWLMFTMQKFEKKSTLTPKLKELLLCSVILTLAEL